MWADDEFLSLVGNIDVDKYTKAQLIALVNLLMVRFKQSVDDNADNVLMLGNEIDQLMSTIQTYKD